MPLVVFRDLDGGEVAVDAAPESRLLDLCDESGARIPFSCRSATCGTCRVVVLEGAGGLSPPADDEVELLAIFRPLDPAGNAPVHRLACQARLSPRASRVIVRPVTDDE